MMAIFDDSIRRLILSAEIAGYLHDLGKLHPCFASEMLAGGKNLSEEARTICRIEAAHGAILEKGSPYPQPGGIADAGTLMGVLKVLRCDPDWASALSLPSEWVKSGTIQADGLGAPLRQHHADNKFPKDELSFLGDLYAFGADIRDSAFDKGAASAKGGKQDPSRAVIADAFGYTRGPYSAEWLAPLWQEAIDTFREILCASGAAIDIVDTRRALLDKLSLVFEKALGETRRPTNDVTLSHHARSTASFFKAAMAEGALRGDFKAWQDGDALFDISRLGRVRYRLLGVRWEWARLTRGMLSPVALASLSGRRRDAVDAIREQVEEVAAIGNVIYEDDDGVLILTPGFFEDDDKRSEALFSSHVLYPLVERIENAVRLIGTGTPFRLCWSAPALYLTDYAEALGLDSDSPRQRHLQAGEANLRALWDAANAEQYRLMQICPQCGLRPAETREYAPTESAVREQPLCDECAELSDRDAKRARSRQLVAEFGFRPSSFNLEDLAKEAGSSRVALISVHVDSGRIADGSALVTQLARPLANIEAARKAGIGTANALGDWFEQLVLDLRAGRAIDDTRAKMARDLIGGDKYWLSPKDGRGGPLEVAKGFFLRESASLPEEWGLVRHDGDRLALFAMRKHASPARLQRLWDDLRDLWRTIANDLAGQLDARLIPLTLDACGIRLAVAANDADDAVRQIESRVSQTFAKLRGGFCAHVSCVVMRPRFPLYLALDALERMDRRVPDMPRQHWRVESIQRLPDRRVVVVWDTPQGLIRWNADSGTNDPQQVDCWHPHVIVARSQGHDVFGPDRIVHIDALKGGDIALIPPMTFDFLALEGSARRHHLVYLRSGDALRRPHWVMGKEGCSPLLLESFDGFSRLIDDSGWERSKIKGLQGEMVETYENWVRDVPVALRETGREAWHSHLRNMLLRYVKGDDGLRERLFRSIIDGRFFDAVEWTTFVPKSSRTTTLSEASA